MPKPSFPDTFGEPLDFMRLLWAIDHLLQRSSKAMRSTLGISGPQRLVLRIVGLRPNSTAGQIARFVHLHPSTITGILQRLEEKGLIKRHVDSKDARRALFTSTVKAKALLDRWQGTVEDRMREAISRVPQASLAGAKVLLTAIVEELAKNVPEEGGSRRTPRAEQEPSG